MKEYLAPCLNVELVIIEGVLSKGRRRSTDLHAPDRKEQLYKVRHYRDRRDCSHTYIKHVKSIGTREDESTIAGRLYAVLREFDDDGVNYIYSESFATGGIGSAIMNRLLKAAGHHVINIQ